MCLSSHIVHFIVLLSIALLTALLCLLHLLVWRKPVLEELLVLLVSEDSTDLVQLVQALPIGQLLRLIKHLFDFKGIEVIFVRGLSL